MERRRFDRGSQQVVALLLSLPWAWMWMVGLFVSQPSFVLADEQALSGTTVPTEDQIVVDDPAMSLEQVASLQEAQNAQLVFMQGLIKNLEAGVATEVGSTEEMSPVTVSSAPPDDLLSSLEQILVMPNLMQLQADVMNGTVNNPLTGGDDALLSDSSSGDLIRMPDRRSPDDGIDSRPFKEIPLGLPRARDDPDVTGISIGGMRGTGLLLIWRGPDDWKLFVTVPGRDPIEITKDNPLFIHYGDQTARVDRIRVIGGEDEAFISFFTDGRIFDIQFFPRDFRFR